MKWRPGDPRFVVREVDGHVGWTAKPQLSVSVLDAAWNFHEVARFSQENVKGQLRSVDGKHMAGSMTAEAKRESIRRRAAGLAAMLEAEAAVQATKGTEA